MNLSCNLPYIYIYIYICIYIHIYICVNVGNSLVCWANVVKVNFTLKSQEGVCLRASDWSRGVGAFGNAESLSTPGGS